MAFRRRGCCLHSSVFSGHYFFQGLCTADEEEECGTQSKEGNGTDNNSCDGATRETMATVVVVMMAVDTCR